MTGYGVSGGALSIVNGIATGYGAAFGIGLTCRAKVTVSDETTLTSGGVSSDPFFIRCILDEFGIADASVEIESEIPPCVGLKSSSAVADAVLLACADETGTRISPEEILKMNIRASLRAGVSITGACDDAAACLMGGAVFCSSHDGTVLKRVEMPEDTAVLIAVPPISCPTRLFRKDRLDPVRSRRIFDAAMAGEIYASICENGDMVAQACGWNNCAAETAIKNGAVAAGISGTGPATGILVDLDEKDAFLDRWTGIPLMETGIRNGRA